MIVATLTILMVTLVPVAKLSDRIGVKPIMRAGCGLLIAASIPALLLIRFGGSYALIFVGVLLIGLTELCFDSTSPSALPALFPTNVRNGALAVGYNIPISVVGGSTPVIAQTLMSTTGNVYGAGLHADRRGPGRRCQFVVHARSGGQAVAWFRACGRNRTGSRRTGSRR